MTAHACAEVLAASAMGLGASASWATRARASTGTSAGAAAEGPRSSTPRPRSVRCSTFVPLAEQAQIRSAAQLIDIGYQAMCHVLRPGVTDREMFAAFTFAQMARGGEWGDGYQIGINQWGTHVGKPYGHVVRPGDLINLYASAVTYHGYTAQSARMMAVGEITAAQETTLEMCTDAVQRAERLIRPVYPL